MEIFFVWMVFLCPDQMHIWGYKRQIDIQIYLFTIKKIWKKNYYSCYYDKKNLPVYMILSIGLVITFASPYIWQCSKDQSFGGQWHCGPSTGCSANHRRWVVLEECSQHHDPEVFVSSHHIILAVFVCLTYSWVRWVSQRR